MTTPRPPVDGAGVLLAIDPGLRYPAAAVFVKGILIAASRVKVPGALAQECLGERCRVIGGLIARWAATQTGLGFDRVVIEWPKVYRGRKGKADPADLIPLAGVGCAVAALCGAPCTSVEPSEWASQTLKSTTGDPWASPRGYRVHARLSATERASIVPSHDALDAVGIGLWYLGRFAPITVNAGATPG